MAGMMRKIPMYRLKNKARVGAMYHGITRAGLLALTSCLTLSCAVFGIRSTPEPVYTVVHQESNKEIHHYEGYLVATTWSDGTYEQASNRGFRHLFDYISGRNSSQHTITMTAPVLQETAVPGATMAMTAPVLQTQDQQGWSMAFVMPATYTMATLPRPLDDTITLHEVPAAQVAVLRYSWGTSAAHIHRLGQELVTWIARQERYEVTSKPRSARYDPPFTVPFLRRNEIHVDVRNKLE